MPTPPAARVNRPRAPGRFVLLLLAACVLSTFAGCAKKHQLVAAPNLYTAGREDPFAAVPEPLRSDTVEVLFATDRLLETDKQGRKHYGYERSYIMDYGLAQVRIGQGASWEDLTLASRTNQSAGEMTLAVESSDAMGRTPRPDALVPEGDRWVISPAFVEGMTQTTKAMHELIGRQLAHSPRKEVYVFIHGYNTPFDSSVMKIAQLWHFLGRQGVPAAFSWPAGSSGPLRGYNEDRESSEFAVPHLKAFIRILASCPDVEKINCIAHSRGTDVLMNALRELHIECHGGGRDTRKELKLGQVILAAPDIDLEVFMAKMSAEHTAFVPQQLTVYSSQNDKAIGISDWLFRSVQRLGRLRSTDMDPDMIRALESHPVASLVNVDAKTDWVGHGYFLTNPAVLSDVILILRDGRRPGAEHGRPLTRGTGGIWHLPDGYPAAPPAEK